MNIIYILQLIRIQNLILAGFSVFIAAYLLDSHLFSSFFNVSFIVMSTMALGNIMNDFLDIESDKFNHPNRALVNNKITTIHVMIAFFCSICVLLYSSMSINLNALRYLYLFIIPALFSYNIYFKKIPIVGNLIVSLLLGSVFLFTEVVVFNSIKILFIPFCLATIFSFVREMIKDMEDYTGDKYVGMFTLPIMVGPEVMRRLIVFSILVLMVALFIPYFYFSYNFKYFLSLIILIEIPLIYSLILLIKYPSKKTYQLLANLFKILTLGGLIIIMVSKQ